MIVFQLLLDSFEMYLKYDLITLDGDPGPSISITDSAD
jgi:hypothetical protein